MSKLVPPHGGGPLKPLLVPREKRAEALERAGRLKKVPVTSREVSDLFMLGMGAYTPLDGFMGHDDWRCSVTEMKLANGVFWPIPDHAVAGTRDCRQPRRRRGGGACRCRNRRGARPAHRTGKIRDRPRARMQARISHHRSQASRGGEGDAAGRGQHRRPCDCAFGG